MVIDESTKRKIRPDPDYENRPGYIPDFLGSDFPIQLPWIDNKRFVDVARNRMATSNRHVLPYYHFSVVMNRRRRLAFFSAVNIDGRQEVSVPRDNFRDEWYLDPRIGEHEQIQNELYAGNPLDRGHMVRRLDPTWGGTLGEALVAHDDTFHWTNCGPQHQNYNRNKTTWGGLENYILNNANVRDLRVSVFTGPVFRDDDPEYQTDSGDHVRLPVEYWKVVAMVKEEGHLSATAYLVSQRELIDAMIEEEFQYGSYRSYQTSVREVERLADLSFQQLRDFDPFDTGEVAEGAVTALRELKSFKDIVI